MSHSPASASSAPSGSPATSSLTPSEVCDVVGGMLRQMERVGDGDVGVVVAALGGMLRKGSPRKKAVGMVMEELGELLGGCEDGERLYVTKVGEGFRVCRGWDWAAKAEVER